jgi:hypothetical protein
MLHVIATVGYFILGIGLLFYGYRRWRHSGANDELLWSLLGLLFVFASIWDNTIHYVIPVTSSAQGIYALSRQLLDFILLTGCLILAFYMYVLRPRE